MNFFQLIKKLNVYFLLAGFGPFFYAPIAVYVKEKGFGTLEGESFINQKSSYNITLAITSFVILVLTLTLVGLLKRKLKRTEDLTVKFKAIKFNYIFNSIVLGIGLVANLIPLFMTFSKYFILYGAVMFVIILFRRPTVRSILDEADLNEEQLEKIQDENFKIV